METVDRASLAQFDMIIDVRSPAEFAEDHVPGAVNLPVLDNEQRALVGTTYVQESRFLARRIGGAMVARNVAHHLDTALSDKPPTFKPLVYCWRGGQRSNAMALILAQVGWRTLVLKGGYKTYRRDVQKRLYDAPLPHRLIVLSGETGSGKTEILNRVAALGGQVVDLEEIALHRGSLFGAHAGKPQPSQKWFESCLAAQFDKLDPAKPVLVEAESYKIGNRTLPPSIWQAMAGAPRIDLNAPLDVRSEYLLRTYPGIAADRELLEAAFSQLQLYPGRKRLAAWREMADAGDFLTLIREVVERHYDPAYAGSLRREQRRLIGSIPLTSLDDATQDDAARRILGLMQHARAAA
jgi:tRNA 2-selenouridine synthase